MTQHTPGPWKVHKSGDGLYDWGVEAGNEWLVEDQTEADCHLIAAAPELLEALKLAASIIGHPEDAGSKFIAAAIAKAEGRT